MSGLPEKEATLYWCPFGVVRRDASIVDPLGTNVTQIALTSVTRNDDGEPAAMCIGSRCMAWRWTRDPSETVDENTVPATGYCGMAGKP